MADPNVGNELVAWVSQATVYLATGVEASAALIVTIAAIQAVLGSLSIVFKPTDETAKEDIRLSFGRWLALALEFELAADILRTTTAPTWNEIGQLAAIVVLRTALNYFLQREIDSADARKVTKPSVGLPSRPE
ncbi:DUF1622 domain-containing protein [soil metagenome]